MSETDPDLRLDLARIEGKLDAWSMQHARHEDRLNAHSAKLDQVQTQVTALATRQSAQQEDRRSRPTWPTVTSAVVAAAMAVLFLAQQLYGG